MHRIVIAADLAIIGCLAADHQADSARVRPTLFLSFFSLRTIPGAVVSVTLVRSLCWLDRLPSCRCIRPKISPSWRERRLDLVHDLFFNGPFNLVVESPEQLVVRRGLSVPGLDGFIDHSKFDKEESSKMSGARFTLRGRDLKGRGLQWADSPLGYYFTVK